MMNKPSTLVHTVVHQWYTSEVYNFGFVVTSTTAQTQLSQHPKDIIYNICKLRNSEWRDQKLCTRHIQYSIPNVYSYNSDTHSMVRLLTRYEYRAKLNCLLTQN